MSSLSETTQLRGRWHYQVNKEEVQSGDYIEFDRQGLRTRKVLTVKRTRKGAVVVSFEPLAHITVFKKRKVDLREVRRVWRRGHKDGC